MFRIMSILTLLILSLSSPSQAKSFISQTTDGRILLENSTKSFRFPGTCYTSLEKFHKNSDGDFIVEFETDDKGCGEMMAKLEANK